MFDTWQTKIEGLRLKNYIMRFLIKKKRANRSVPLPLSKRQDLSSTKLPFTAVFLSLAPLCTTTLTARKSLSPFYAEINLAACDPSVFSVFFNNNP